MSIRFIRFTTHIISKHTHTQAQPNATMRWENWISPELIVCVCRRLLVLVTILILRCELNCPISLTVIWDCASPKTFYCGFRWFYFLIWANLVFSMHLRMHSVRCRWFDCDASPILPNLANDQIIHPIWCDPIRYHWAIWNESRNRICIMHCEFSDEQRYCWK